MTVNQFAREISKLEGMKKQVNIAQIKEVLNCIRALLYPTGVNLYKLIKLIKRR